MKKKKTPKRPGTPPVPSAPPETLCNNCDAPGTPGRPCGVCGGTTDPDTGDVTPPDVSAPDAPPAPSLESRIVALETALGGIARSATGSGPEVSLQAAAARLAADLAGFQRMLKSSPLAMMLGGKK